LVDVPTFFLPPIVLFLNWADLDYTGDHAALGQLFDEMDGRRLSLRDRRLTDIVLANAYGRFRYDSDSGHVLQMPFMSIKFNTNIQHYANSFRYIVITEVKNTAGLALRVADDRRRNDDEARTDGIMNAEEFAALRQRMLAEIAAETVYASAHRKAALGRRVAEVMDKTA
jgi:hypothetical protein